MSDLNQEALEAAHRAYETFGQTGHLKAQRLSDECISSIISTYLAALPSSDLVERLPLYRFDSGLHTWGTDGGSMNEQEDGDWVNISDLRELSTHITTLEADKAELEVQVDGMHRKIMALASHGTCACSYDSEEDLCIHHSPRLLAAEEKIEALMKERTNILSTKHEQIEALALVRDQALEQVRLLTKALEEARVELDREREKP